MKKILSLILSLSLIFSLAGCKLYEGKKRVVALSYENEIFDSAQNQECLNGLKLLASDMRVSYFVNENKDEFKDNLDTIINEGHELIWLLEPEGKDILIKKAKEYPDSHFGIIDCNLEKIPSNVTTLTFRVEEGGFLAGYMAAKQSVSRNIGFLGGKQNEVSKRYEVGFRAGAIYGANKMNNPVFINVLYTGDDNSKPHCEKGAETLYLEKNCDIIFHTLNSGGLGAVEKAKELGKYIICSGTDQASYAPNNVLASIIKNTKTSINTVTTMFSEGTEIFGKNFDYGIKERVIGISKTNVNLPREIYKEAMDLRKDIAGGSIKVPSNEEELQQFLNN